MLWKESRENGCMGKTILVFSFLRPHVPTGFGFEWGKEDKGLENKFIIHGKNTKKISSDNNKTISFSIE